MIRNGPDSAVRAVPAISRKRPARARRDWTSWLRTMFGSASLEGRQGRNNDEDHSGPAERRIGDDNRRPAVHSVLRSCFAMKHHDAMVPRSG